MREGWTIRKLGDICSSFSGYTPSGDLLHEVGAYPYFKVAEMNRQENLKVMSSTDAFIDNPTKVYRKGAIVFPKNGAAISTNKKRILGQDSVVDLNTGGFLADEKIVSPLFLFYLMQHIDFKRYVRRGAVPTLDIKELKLRECLIPSVQVQEKIVAELELLSGIIDKYKQQLKELDTLAQSIFYDMFGDPVANERGWKVKKLGDIGEIVSGSTPSTTDETNWDGDVNWITPAEMGVQLYYGETERKITQKAAKRLTLMPVGTILLSSRAPIGKLAISSVPMCCNQGFKNIICGEGIDNVFLYYYLMLTMEHIKALGRGATFKEVSKQAISAYTTIIPPLPLQQSFSEKIEAIEKQKDSVKQAIKETETLFNSRMDYYFN